MAQLTYRANLTAAELPLLSEFQGRNVINIGPDQNYSRQASSPKNKDRDIGIPQIYYCHNVIPTDAGVTSVGYSNLIAAPLDTNYDFDDIFLIRDSNDNVGYLAVTATGKCYVFVNTSLGWVATTTIAVVAGGEISTAYVNGETYIYFGLLGCYRYDFASNTLVSVTLTGLNPALILGITTAAGYLIAWTTNKVFWSSTITPTDFLPSLVTGAGSSGVQQAKATIVSCLPHSSGFVIYTKSNAVAAVFSNNIQAPFTFRENVGSGGLSNFSLIAFDGNSSDHVGYTTSGLQQISLTQSQQLFPQVTDFISGAQFEDFDDTTLRFSQQLLNQPMQKKLAIISNRYLIISYGVNSLTHAIYYDLALARMGKLKIPHVDVFEYTYPSPAVVDAPRKSIAFMQADGSIKLLNLQYNTTGANGTIIAGKYQLDRNRYVTILETHLESVQADSMLSVNWSSTIDGTNGTVSTPTLAESAGTYRRYNSLLFGLNHSLIVQGAFNLNSLVLKFTDAGAVR